MSHHAPFAKLHGKLKADIRRYRLENDFIVFRGSETESSGQLLKGTVVLCLSAPLKIEDVHLRLTGTLHYAYAFPSGFVLLIFLTTG